MGSPMAGNTGCTGNLTITVKKKTISNQANQTKQCPELDLRFILIAFYNIKIYILNIFVYSELDLIFVRLTLNGTTHFFCNDGS